MAAVSWYYKIKNIILFQKYCFVLSLIFYSSDWGNDLKLILTNDQTFHFLQCVLTHVFSEKVHRAKKSTYNIDNFVDSMHYMVLRWGVSMYFLELQYTLSDSILDFDMKLSSNVGFRLLTWKKQHMKGMFYC